MNRDALATLFYQQVLKIHEQDTDDLSQQVDAQYKLLNLLYVEATKEEKLQFTTLFARIAFAGHKYNLSKQLLFYVHEFRKNVRNLKRKDQANPELEVLYLLGLQVLTVSISSLFKQGIPGELANILPPEGFYKTSPTPIQSTQQFRRLVVLGIDKEAELLIAIGEENPEQEIHVKYNIADSNEQFNDDINALEHIFGFPSVVNLLDIEIDNEGVYRPKGIVIEPDYLVDASAIAECFSPDGIQPFKYILKKFIPFQTTVPLMLGNVANFFLDELMNDPDISFKETFPEVFRLNPLAFTIFANSEVREIMQKSQKHFIHLKNMVKRVFEENEIKNEHCFLEPSFYAPRYGIQGRLDIFHYHPEHPEQSAIVELKSGKPWRPNRWGLNINHYVQTLMYDLMIKAVFDDALRPTNYILYSGQDEKQLRFAPVTKTQQYEALHLRNQLLAIEYQLSKMDTADHFAQLLRKIDTSNHPTVSGYVGKDIQNFAKIYQNLSPLERDYFHGFIALIAREHRLAKTGIQGIEQMNGLAGLWLNEFEEKIDQFNILSHLELTKVSAKEEEPFVYFKKTKDSSQLSNFREGDVAILSPLEEGKNGVLSNQIFKCTIIQLDEVNVVVRLRAKQFNHDIFQSKPLWNLEHDLFDSGYTSMYQGLFKFMKSPAHKKALLLTTKAPAQPNAYDTPFIPKLTYEQNNIFYQAIHAPDYFLLWGPPGTGKTSVMLKQFVSYIINETDENILLLAYTNRAVDEMCEAVESIDSRMKEEYIRIGSPYSTNEKFKGQLLSEKTKNIHKRADLQDLIDNHRIFISTVASMVSKQDLLKLKTFQRVIIDEASQILEPLLVGLLPQFEQFILIGDHKQLPAVVSQPKEASATDSPLLQEVGLNNLRDSLFERLFKRCQANNWDWAYAQLSHQGRMHQDIMAFPNKYFYIDQLDILPEEVSFRHQQIAPLNYALPRDTTALEKLIAKNRMVFIPTDKEYTLNFKTNPAEAKQIAELVQSFERIYIANGWEITPNSIGVITPYRAQIAQIQQELQNSQLETPTDFITVDTVERYQGGARDIILISLCMNHVSQLDSLISESDEGVDRKLNVALTRARKHCIILGNPHILKLNQGYRRLMDFCAKGGLDFQA